MKRVEPRAHVIDVALASGNRNAWKQALGFPTEEPMPDNPEYPFPRQPLPVTVTITGDDPRDVAYWFTHLARVSEFKGDSTQKIHPSAFIIYPRAVND